MSRERSEVQKMSDDERMYYIGIFLAVFFTIAIAILFSWEG